MTDDIDVYLERSLKNWAERDKSHARSKDSLLRLAAAQSDLDDRDDLPFPRNSFEEFRNYRQSMMYARMYLRGSCAVPLGWTVDFSMLLRQAQ